LSRNTPLKAGNDYFPKKGHGPFCPPLAMPMEASNQAVALVSSEISDFTPITHAQSNMLHTKYADKPDY